MRRLVFALVSILSFQVHSARAESKVETLDVSGKRVGNTNQCVYESQAKDRVFEFPAVTAYISTRVKNIENLTTLRNFAPATVSVIERFTYDAKSDKDMKSYDIRVSATLDTWNEISGACASQVIKILIR